MKNKNNKAWLFKISPYWESEIYVNCTALMAFQIASNYESDLYVWNPKKDKFILILSPLGMYYEANNNMIKRNLGKDVEFSSLGYENYTNEIIVKRDDLETIKSLLYSPKRILKVVDKENRENTLSHKINKWFENAKKDYGITGKFKEILSLGNGSIEIIVEEEGKCYGVIVRKSEEYTDDQLYEKWQNEFTFLREY